MPSTTNYNFGDVVLVPFPFTNQASSKKRPAVIISSGVYHQHHPDLIVMAITSQRIVQSFGEVMVSDWQGAGLLRPSAIKPVIATLERHLVIKTLGHLSAQDQRMVKDALQAILGGVVVDAGPAEV